MKLEAQTVTLGAVQDNNKLLTFDNQFTSGVWAMDYNEALQLYRISILPGPHRVLLESDSESRKPTTV